MQLWLISLVIGMIYILYFIDIPKFIGAIHNRTQETTSFLGSILSSLKGRDLSHRRVVPVQLGQKIPPTSSLPTAYDMEIAPYPQDFLDEQFDEKTKQQKDQYIGDYDNAGVIYDEKFARDQVEKSFSIKEPSSFTPYIEDYVQST
jgi:hypothetical protein